VEELPEQILVVEAMALKAPVVDEYKCWISQDVITLFQIPISSILPLKKR
jgi:hypothetical protein